MPLEKHWIHLSECTVLHRIVITTRSVCVKLKSDFNCSRNLFVTTAVIIMRSRIIWKHFHRDLLFAWKFRHSLSRVLQSLLQVEFNNIGMCFTAANVNILNYSKLFYWNLLHVSEFRNFCMYVVVCTSEFVIEIVKLLLNMTHILSSTRYTEYL